MGLDFIESLGLLDIPLNPVCNAVSRSPAQNAIKEKNNDTIKHFSPVFTDNFRCCTQAEAILTFKPSAISVFQPKQPAQPWSWIHVDFTGLINGDSFLVEVKCPEIFQMQNADICSVITILKRLCRKHWSQTMDHYLHPALQQLMLLHTYSVTTLLPTIQWSRRTFCEYL